MEQNNEGYLLFLEERQNQRLYHIYIPSLNTFSSKRDLLIENENKKCKEA